MKMRALAGLALFACLAGCGRSPEPAQPSARRADIVLPPDTQTIESRIARNATLDSIFREAALRADVAVAAIEAVRGAFRPRQLLRAEQPSG